MYAKIQTVDLSIFFEDAIRKYLALFSFLLMAFDID